MDTARAAERISEAVRTIVETRDTEYKSSQPFAALKWKIVRTAIAIANLREGGRIIIGVVEDRGIFTRTGITPDHEREYTQDEIFTVVNRHARPGIDLVVLPVEDNGMRFVGIEIAPFDRTPIFCGVATPQEAGNDGLRVGDLPARDLSRIATSRVHDPDLVAEILEVAAEKRARSIIVTAQRIGLIMPDADATRFAQERQDFGDFE